MYKSIKELAKNYLSFNPHRIKYGKSNTLTILSMSIKMPVININFLKDMLKFTNLKKMEILLVFIKEKFMRTFNPISTKVSMSIVMVVISLELAIVKVHTPTKILISSTKDSGATKDLMEREFNKATKEYIKDGFMRERSMELVNLNGIMGQPIKGSFKKDLSMARVI